MRPRESKMRSWYGDDGEGGDWSRPCAEGLTSSVDFVSIHVRYAGTCSPVYSTVNNCKVRRARCQNFPPR